VGNQNQKDTLVNLEKFLSDLYKYYLIQFCTILDDFGTFFSPKKLMEVISESD